MSQSILIGIYHYPQNSKIIIIHSICIGHCLIYVTSKSIIKKGSIFHASLLVAKSTDEELNAMIMKYTGWMERE